MNAGIALMLLLAPMGLVSEAMAGNCYPMLDMSGFYFLQSRVSEQKP